MGKNQMIIFKLLRKLYTRVFTPEQQSLANKICDPKIANEKVFELLEGPNPCMIARYGAFELATIINYLGVTQEQHSVWEYIKGKELDWCWNEKLLKSMQSNAGFFPITHKQISKYCKLMLEDSKKVDLLESWLNDEYQLKDYLKTSLPITAEIMGPYFFKNPWTRALKGKRVLVVHPFADTIKNQYKKRERLFKDPDVLPAFELQTLKAIQSIGGNSQYNDWFEALEDMKLQISACNFDICIIGCGAYGFPLAAHVKRIGKKAIQLAGMTQLLFGIWGARWDKNNYSKYNYKDLLNEYWVRPSQNECPQNASKVENGCYW